MGRQVGVTDASVEWQMRTWSDWWERGVAGGSVECRQECENGGEEVSAIQDAQRVIDYISAF